MTKKMAETGKTFLRHLYITFEFFGKNALANHAAAGAYAFLLSAAPMLLLAASFLLMAFSSVPGAAEVLLQTMPFAEAIFDAEADLLSGMLYGAASPGIPELLGVLSMFWAGRIFAVFMGRSFKIIFPGENNRGAVLDNIVTLAVELAVLLLILGAILFSRYAISLYYAAGFLPSVFANIYLGDFQAVGLSRALAAGVLGFLAFQLIPANSPGKLSAVYGAIFCAVLYGAAAWFLDFFLMQPRYNLIYGALGNIVILLINVYFFFMTFFLGAQFASVSASFEALCFMRLRETVNAGGGEVASGKKTLRGRLSGLFGTVDKNLEKYRRRYAKGETIMCKGDTDQDVFFLLEGEVEVFVPIENEAGESDLPADSFGTLSPGAFFGEMSHFLEESRSATIIAKTDACVLALPPGIFDKVVSGDSELGKAVIEHLSMRIKKSNEKIAAMGH